VNTASLFAQLTVVSIQQIFGVQSQWIHHSTKPTIKYMELMHFVITKFLLFHFWGSADLQVS